MAASEGQTFEIRSSRRRGRLILTCTSIALNAATAGGIFTFPLISPALSSHLHLTQPQLTSIVLAGVAGQYPFASVVGKVIDKVGPWASSLASALLFSTGFGLFSLEVRKTSASVPHLPTSSFYRLVFFYFLAGLGTASSYFSALFCASKNFPKYVGLASGCSMAIFGLSPMILSLFASSFFTDPTQNVHVANYTAFLAIITGVVNGLGAILLRVEPQDSELPLLTSSNIEESHEHVEHAETSPLLKHTTSIRSYDRVLDVLGDSHFWILMCFAFLTLSCCEMVISNIGTISLAVPRQPVRHILSTTTQHLTTKTATPVEAVQVRLISISNTISRIAAGAAADFISPVASYLPSGVAVLPRHHKLSRVAFLTGSSLLMVLAFMWMNVVVTNQHQIWVFSLAIGSAYGTIFTILPSVVSGIWGLENLARNFGLLTYAPFVGTPLFSYLYAFMSSSGTEGGEGVCSGMHCLTVTFSVCISAGLMATVLSCWLWRGWRKKI